MNWRFWASLCMILSVCGCASSGQVVSPADVESQEVTVQGEVPSVVSPVETCDSPFCEGNLLEYGIVDFSKLKSEDFRPALIKGMSEQMAEIEAIVQQSEAPTFENTVVALERSGEYLTRVASVFFGFTNSKTDDIIQALEQEMASKLAAHSDAILLNERLFHRIEAVYAQKESLNLDLESGRLLEDYYKEFVRAGARLTPDQKKQISAYNSEIAQLETVFGQNILNERNDSAVIVDTIEELEGLSDAEIQVAADNAKRRGLDGKYLLSIQNTSIQPILKSLKNRALRERVHKASLSRGLRGNNYDNREMAFRLIELRALRTELLGYATFADYAVENQMAKTADAVNTMLQSMVEPALASAKKEAAELQKLIDDQGGKFKLEAHDWLFYSEQLRKQKFDLDDNALKPYFELQNVLENGVFYAANRLYGITFKERTDIPVYDPDVRIWEIIDTDGKVLAVYFGDYYARDSKRGGAWMSDYVHQSKLLNHRPVIENQLNIAKPAQGEKTLLTFDEVTTLFHEFGHALHAIFSDVTYPRFAGTNVPRDFVEFPSQFNEVWAHQPEILEHFAVHYETGEKLPKALLDKVIAAGKFNQGYMTTEYLSAAILDQKWHQLSSTQIDALKGKDFESLENDFLKQAGLDPQAIPPRYRTAYFNHIFANGYSAGYYAYIWAEVLDADAEQWFVEHGMTRENGDKLRKEVLSRGFSEESMKLYRAFAGRDPSSEPLLIRRGLK